MLSKLKIEEISGVDKGANEDARVSFWKCGHSQKQETKKMDIDQLAERLEKLEAENEVLQKIAKFSDAEKVFIDTMDEEQRKRFLDLDGEGRKKELGAAKKADDEAVAKKKADDEAAKKAADEAAKKGDGAVDKKDAISKADFEAVQKKAADLEETVKKMQEEKELHDFAKKAEAELPNLSGSADEKGKFIKALFSMKKEDRDIVMAGMKTADKITSDYFLEKGTSARGADDPEAKLDVLAKAEMKASKTDYAQAYDAVTKTDEGKKLYEQSLPALN